MMKPSVIQCFVCVIHAAIQTSHKQKSIVYATNTEKFLPVKQNVLLSASAAATFCAESENARYPLTFSGIYSLGLFADEPEQNQAFNLQPDH